MSEIDIDNKLKEGKVIERELHITEKEIKNFVEYLRVSASDKSTFVPCGCLKSQLDVSPSFHRAFKYFTRQEKVDYFYKIMVTLRSCFEGEQTSLPEQQTKGITLYFFNEDEGSWETRRVQVHSPSKTFKFQSGGEQINFHHYILRNSKKKDKKSLALESTDSLQVSTTIRVSNYKQTLDQLRSMLEKLIFSAAKQNFLKILGKVGKIPQRRESKELTDKIKLIKIPTLKNQMESPDLIKKPTPPPIKVQPNENGNKSVTKSNDKFLISSYQSSGSQINSIQYDKMKLKLINSLTNFANLTESSKNLYIDLKQNRVRKIYEIKEDDYTIPLEWFSDNLMSSSSFRKWKKTLKLVKTINKKSAKQKIFHQTHEFKQKITSEYLYKREKYDQRQDCIYFFDVSAQDPQSKLQSNNKIQYVIWKFQRNNNYLVITVEGKITHQNIKVGNLSVSLTEQFLGDIDKICSNSNVTLLGDTNFNINTVLFEEQYISRLGESNQFDDDDQFYSIQNEEVEDSSPGKKIGSTIIKVNALRRSTEEVQVPPKLPSLGSLSSPFAKNRLKWRHPMIPFAKPVTPKLKLPKTPGQCPYWQNQFKFNEKGDMISVNTKKLQAQKGVLSQLIKSIGRNLLSGKSILNISLPVTVFSYESNLSLLCKSFAYAPMHLQRAAKSVDPIQRLKYVVAFGLGCTTSYIQMDKPFNPILGETFHTLIDGCPVYGEQTCHHPPISSILMKGRGYTIYGSFEAKVNMGLNSAKGSNEGITYVSFDEKDFRKKIVKFTCPPGQISGLIVGERIIKGVDKTHYLDVDSMLYLQLRYGKHKGITEYCKFQNGIQGKLLQLDPYTDISTFPNIKTKNIVKELGIFSGKWSEALYYEDELIFNSWKEYPHACEDYPCPFQSDAFYRKDLLLRIQEKMEEAQTAKEELENIQRNDRKLRKKYTGREQ